MPRPDRRFRATKQCPACPWKVATDPECDIPGYDVRKHLALARTCPPEGVIADRVFSCHETREGDEAACVGWLAHGMEHSNLAVRLAAARGDFDPQRLVLDGEQHASFEATLPASVRACEGLTA